MGSEFEKKNIWERVKRVPVYESPKIARFPSVERTQSGAILVLLTRRSEAQEKRGAGDLVLVKSADGGESWSDARLVYKSNTGEPRAIGTLTCLPDGEMVAPFAVISPDGLKSTLYIARSSDDGENWETIQPHTESPFHWQAPSGRLVRTSTGEMAMGVFGTYDAEELQSTVHSAALLFSKDGGASWGGFSLIARGNGQVIGAHGSTRFSFEGPAVQPLSDGRWLAMVTARRLGEGSGTGPGAPQVLCRCWSTDEGKSWSAADQLTVGAWSSLAAIDARTIVCPFTEWCAFAGIKMIFSYDGFETFTQELPVLLRGWLKGWGRHNVDEEVPAYPAVPFVSEREWRYAHFGFPSACALDERSLVVVIGRPQAGVRYYDHADLDKPAGKERIDLIFYERQEGPRRAVKRSASRKVTPEDRWLLASRFHCGFRLSALIRCPDGRFMGIRREGSFVRSPDEGKSWEDVPGAGLEGTRGRPCIVDVLESGRWILITGESLREESEWPVNRIGMMGGFPVTKMTDCGLSRCGWAYYSDDEGKTWKGGQQMLVPALHLAPDRGFYHAPDGTLLFNGYGCLSPEENDAYASSVLVFRSVDEGQSWGDATIIARPEPKKPDEPHPEPCYTETYIQMMPDGLWVAFIRTEWGMVGPMGTMSRLSRTESVDGGRTWSKPERFLVTGSQQQSLILPDGALALMQRSHSWQQAGVCISYDAGNSWSYALAGPYGMGWAFTLTDDEFVVFAADGRAARYRRNQ